MISPQKGRDVIDTSATLDKHIDTVPYLLLTHAITGCDSVAAYSGISKNKALKILRQKSMNSAIISRLWTLLNFLWKQLVSFSRVTAKAAKLQCHSLAKNLETENWKISNYSTQTGVSSTNKRKTQFKIWLSSVDEKPPNLDSTDYGWTVHQASKSMIPTMTRPGVSMAPEKLLKLLKCSCKKEPLCKSARCGCNRAQLGCSEFCSCFEQLCSNPNNVLIDESEDDSNCEDDDSNCDDTK